MAAVIVEPIAGNMVCTAEGEILHSLREQTSKHGSLLIFDEVMTGFRVAPGGAQEKLGIAPDLTLLGKVIGGGLPVSLSVSKLDYEQPCSCRFCVSSRHSLRKPDFYGKRNRYFKTVERT